MHDVHQDFFMNVAFSRNRTLFSEEGLRIHPRIWQIRRFEGVRFLPNSHAPIAAPLLQSRLEFVDRGSAVGRKGEAEEQRRREKEGEERRKE
jgi:hypothetical protein